MKKNGIICLVSMFPSWVMVFKLPKKVRFLQFCADLNKNLSLLKQFTYINLKVLVTLFQKILRFLVGTSGQN